MQKLKKRYKQKSRKKSFFNPKLFLAYLKFQLLGYLLAKFQHLSAIVLQSAPLKESSFFLVVAADFTFINMWRYLPLRISLPQRQHWTSVSISLNSIFHLPHYSVYKERLFSSYGQSLYIILKVMKAVFDSGCNNKTFFCAKWYVFSERVTYYIHYYINCIYNEYNFAICYFKLIQSINYNVLGSIP